MKSNIHNFRHLSKTENFKIDLFLAALSIVAASLFALQTDDRANSFVITRGEAFYMQVKYNEMTKSLLLVFH